MESVKRPTDIGSEAQTDISSEAKHLISVQGLYSSAMAISAIFLNVYLFDVGGYASVAWYQLVDFAVITVMFVLVGYSLRRRYDSRSVMRAGLAMLIVEFLTLLVAGERARHMAPLLGAIDGVAQGLYWAGVNVNEYVATHASTRNLYMGRLALWFNLGPAVSQLAAGGVIAMIDAFVSRRSAYLCLFALLAVAFAITYIRSGGSSRLSGVQFSVRDLRLRGHGRLWQLALTQQFLVGIYKNLLGAFVSVLIIDIVRGDFALSLFMTTATVVAGVAGAVAGRILHRHKRAYLIGALVTPVGLVGFALLASWAGLVLFLLGFQMLEPFFKQPVNKSTYDVQEHSGVPWQVTYHYFVEREIVLNGGRILGFACVLVLLTTGQGENAVRYTLAATAVIPPIVGLLQHRMNKLLADPLIPLAASPAGAHG